MTSTYDHRIIQGAESGRFLQRHRGAAPGRGRLLRGVFVDLGVAAPRAAASRRRRPLAAAAAARRRAAAAPGGRRPRELLQAVQAATSLLKAHRTHGHLAASSTRSAREPERRPGARPRAARPHARADGADPGARSCACTCPGDTLADALPHLRETYCGPIAYEIEHIASHRQRVWLREKIESGAFREPLTADGRSALLRRLTKVDAFERFMHKAYLGQKQFSIEGLDMTVPMLDELIQLVGGARRARGRDRDGPPRPAQRARPQPRPRLRDDLRRVRGRLRRSRR